jgi:hypothetical protein
MLEAYFDDSGTHDESPIVVVGGLLGTTEQWMYLDDHWRPLLDAPLEGKPKLKQFHLSHCAALDGEFSGYKRPESDHLRWKFRKIIVDAGLRSISYGIQTAAWNRHVKGKYRKLLGGSAEAFCVAACVRAAFQEAAKKRQDIVSVTFDQGRNTPQLAEWADKAFGSFIEDMGDMVALGPNFWPVSSVTALQAADTIATETYWFAKRRINGEAAISPHLASLIKGIESNAFILDEQNIEKWVRERGSTGLLSLV